MGDVANPRYDASISAEKGVKGAVAGGVGAATTTALMVVVTAVQAGSLSEAGATALVGAGFTLLTAGVSGFWEWRRNRKKHRMLKRRKLNYSKLPVALCVLGLGALVPGCVTTTLPDGTVIQRLDVDSLQAAYALYLSESQRLHDQGVQDDAAAEQRRVQRMAELNALLLNLTREFDRRGLLPPVVN